MAKMLDVSSFTLRNWVVFALGVILVQLVVRFIAKLIYQRRLVRGLPGPPHSFLFGHLISMGKVMAQHPRRAAPQTFPHFVKEAYGLGDFFYLDVWPMGPTLLAILSPDGANEIMLKSTLPKHPVVADFMDQIGGRENLVSSDGPGWKSWRAAFNPGFSASHLMTLVPGIVDDVAVFCEIVQQHAKDNDIFRMERAATKLTVDIIGKVVLDVELNSQRGPNVLVDTFNSQVQWQAVGAQFNPWEVVDFRRPIVQRWNTWIMNRYISKCLDERFATRNTRGKQKHVIDLALEAYLKQEKGTSADDIKGLDATFKTAAVNNIKTFVFAGHDTTSSTICYCYYYLSKNPSTLDAIRREHDEVFGNDPSAAADMIKEDAILLNKLDYTLAVIKEVLRLQPPASTVRQGQKGFFVHDPKTGEAYPTENFMVWPVDVGLHRHAGSWGDPNVFRPERFLSNKPAPEGANKDAFVAFSKGTRSCIGQELAVIETKVILAMTMRSFDFESAYGELDKLKGDGTGYPSDMTGVQEQFGDEAYQIQLGTAKPREGMPCRIKLRKT